MKRSLRGSPWPGSSGVSLHRARYSGTAFESIIGGLCVYHIFANTRETLDTIEMEGYADGHYDVVIVGSGISGIDAAYYLQQYCPWVKFCILERRQNLGGTWDFFKYPGIRSDSDMYTFGFSWKIWKAENPIATADQILDYLNEAVIEQNLVEKIRFGVNVKSASFSSSRTMWTLQTDVGAKYTCNMLFGCTGYYSYELPNKPVFPGAANFKGVVVHPSEWTQEHDKAIIDKSVSIIGSGAVSYLSCE